MFENGTFDIHCTPRPSPEAARGGAISIVRDGDLISIDARSAVLGIHLEIDDTEVMRRTAQRPIGPQKRLGGLLEKYAATVGPANWGAVTHSGNVQWEREP